MPRGPETAPKPFGIAAASARSRVKHLFDADEYLLRYPDVAADRVDPLDHYLQTGWREGRDPNPFFETRWYLVTYLDVMSSGVNPLVHYVDFGETDGYWPCRIFHPGWYAENNDIPLGHGRALAHYLERGHSDGLWPNELFDPKRYLETNFDLRQKGVDPVLHYLGDGHRESREIGPAFPAAWYHREYLDGDMSIDALFHYLTIGRSIGCTPSPRASASYQSHRLFRGGIPAAESSAAGPTSGPAAASVAEQIRFFANPGPDFEEFKGSSGAGTPRAKLVAFYLPQFHTIPENDKWWGAGFSEWRNLARGVPRFVGHYQPRIPRDLGFYDLSDKDVLPRQIELAKGAGIHGFCFYYYYFDGRRILEKPMERYLGDASLAFPFCLIWTNENWTRRWDGFESSVLLRQRHDPNYESQLLADLARHFVDPRYLRVQGRPLFMIYRPGIIPDVQARLDHWRRWFEKECGFVPWLLMVQGFGDFDPRRYGFDGAIEFPPHKIVEDPLVDLRELAILDPHFQARVVSYEQVIERSLSEPPPKEFPLIKALCPDWDNDSRRQGAGLTLRGSSPKAYERWLRELADRAIARPFAGEPLVFVNAWNEWAEAAYLEPDVFYGAAYLNATARALYRPAPIGRANEPDRAQTGA
jgi:Glycosyltransferase WbsX